MYQVVARLTADSDMVPEKNSHEHLLGNLEGKVDGVVISVLIPSKEDKAKTDRYPLSEGRVIRSDTVLPIVYQSVHYQKEEI